MTAYRFRVKYDPDPTSLWRDVVVGADRTIAEFQSVINQAVGLDEDHLWFVGTDEDYWDSDVKYQSPQEYGENIRTGPLLTDEQIYDADDTTIGEMVGQLGLDQYDRICYLYDYGEEWRFYAILKEVLDDEPCDTAPVVVNEKGDDLNQHASPAADDIAPADSSPPDPIDSFPDSAIPVADLRALEDRDDVAHVVVLLSIETGFGAVSERFMIQYDEAGYLLENYPHGWEVVERIDGEDKSEAELLEELVALARDYHAGIAEMTSAISGQQFDEETVEAMNVELDAELERKGYDHL